MYSLIDGLIFPAPKPSYTTDTLKEKLIFVPRYKDFYTLEKTQENNEQIAINRLEESYLSGSQNVSEGAACVEETPRVEETSNFGDERQLSVSESSLQ